MSKTAKLLVISVVCLFLATTFVSAGILDFFTGTQDDLISGSAVSKYSTKEKVTCTFSGGKKVAQDCSSTAGKCRGIGSCTAIVQSKKWGEKVEWKSSCGGYATTITDGRNDKVKFNCAVEEELPVEKSLPVEEKPSTAEQCLVKMPAIIPKNCYTFDQLDLNKDGILNKEDVINDYQDPRIKYCTKSNCDIDGSGKFDAGDMMIFSDLTDYKMVVKNGLFCRTQKYRTSEGLCLDKEGKMFIDSLGGTGQCSTKQELTTSLEEGCNKRCKSEQKPCRMILKSVSTPCE